MNRELSSILCDDLQYRKVCQLHIHICPFFGFYSHIVFAFVNNPPDPKCKFHEGRDLPILLAVIF